MANLTPIACIDALAAIMRTVSNVGIVHDRRVPLPNQDAVKALMFDKDLGVIRGWMISPAPTGTVTTERREHGFYGSTKGGGGALSEFAFQLEGYFQLSERRESEIEAFLVAYAAQQELNSYGYLPGLPAGTAQGDCNMAEFRYVMLAGMYFLHYARLTITFRGRTIG